MGNKKINKRDIVENFLNNVPPEIEYFIKHSMDLSVSVASFLKKNNLSQKELANKLGKEESEISKWLSGNHNLTLKTISKMEEVLDQQLIFTREEIAKRFLPYLFRQIRPAYKEEYLNQIIQYYCLSENINKDITFLIPSGSNISTEKRQEEIKDGVVISATNINELYPNTTINDAA